MATLTLNGNPIHTCGELPLPGHATPPFTLTRTDLSEVSSVDLEGKRVVLSIFPSLDTATCAQSMLTFNALTADLSDTVLLCVSMDLPFAQNLFCGTQGLERAEPASAFRHPEFGQAFGVTLVDGPMRGLFARAVVSLDENGTVLHTELVPELTREPDYELAIHAIRNHHHPCPEDALETTE
ncbi:putative thiol peroxidase [Geothrix limicola]|uniref:Thiol peroxidase n=1 Tax=Geothrix limicola TaxID=2927978 RepID=A0ABQ5QJ24_9BACT|nr:thiol peroxidase [Geothrix limicola]GLH74693.1 putative thiol peroxidase [Geothrix limicola]